MTVYIYSLKHELKIITHLGWSISNQVKVFGLYFEQLYFLNLRFFFFGNKYSITMLH